MLQATEGNLEDVHVLNSLVSLDERFSNLSTSQEYYRNNFKSVITLLDTELDNSIVGYLGIEERQTNEKLEHVISSIVVAGIYDYEEAITLLVNFLPNGLRSGTIVCNPTNLILLKIIRQIGYRQIGSILQCKFTKEV